MPEKNGTGPLGMGAGTGRGFGPCCGYPVQPQWGFGSGFGCGRGYRHLARTTGTPGWMRFSSPIAPDGTPYDPAQEKVLLEDQAKLLQNQLDQIQKRLKDIDH